MKKTNFIIKYIGSKNKGYYNLHVHCEMLRGKDVKVECLARPWYQSAHLIVCAQGLSPFPPFSSPFQIQDFARYYTCTTNLIGYFLDNLCIFPCIILGNSPLVSYDENVSTFLNMEWKSPGHAFGLRTFMIIETFLITQNFIYMYT